MLQKDRIGPAAPPGHDCDVGPGTDHRPDGLLCGERDVRHHDQHRAGLVGEEGVERGAQICVGDADPGAGHGVRCGGEDERHAPCSSHGLEDVGQHRGGDPQFCQRDDDTLLHRGQAYRLTQHGLARDQLFEWVERGADHAVLALTESEATLKLYPFRFRLEMIYAIAGGTLSVTARVSNPGDKVLPCAVGAHPAGRRHRQLPDA